MASPKITPMIRIGSRLTSGPVCATPNRPAQHTVLEDQRDDAEGRDDGQQESGDGRERDQQRAERDHQQQQSQTDDNRQVRRQRVGHPLRDIDVRRGLAGDRQPGAGLLLEGGASARIAWTRSSVATDDGPVPGTTVMMARSLPASSTGVATVTTLASVRSCAAVVSAACCGSLTPVRSATTVSGPLKPGPKPVVSRSYAWRWVVLGPDEAVVGQAEAHVQGRSGQGEQDDGDTADREPAAADRPARSSARPSVGFSPASASCSSAENVLPAHGPMTGDGEQRRARRSGSAARRPPRWRRPRSPSERGTAPGHGQRRQAR